MSRLRNDPHGRGVPTPGILPPIGHGEPIRARGRLLVQLEQIDTRGVVEVSTEHHGVLAVGVANGVPFATGNICRHQFAKLGRGRVTSDGCLECPWHRAHFDVESGAMVSGPKGRLFGFKPYSAVVAALGRRVRLHTVPVELHDGAIWLRH